MTIIANSISTLDIYFQSMIKFVIFQSSQFNFITFHCSYFANPSYFLFLFTFRPERVVVRRAGVGAFGTAG